MTALRENLLFVAPVRNLTASTATIRLPYHHEKPVAGLKERVPERVFVAAIAQATQAALRTHEAEKREALKNAVVHVAINAVVGTRSGVVGDAPIRSYLEIMFLNMVDNFTATH